MVAEDVPGNGVGLAAGQARHDGLQIAVHHPGLSVSGHGALVQAVRCLGLHDDELRGIVGEEVGEITHHGPGKASHARLDEDVGGAVTPMLPQLLRGLPGHGAVALHDPGGNFLIAVPGGVLYNDAVLRLGGLGGGHADAVVVVDFLDGYLGPLFGDVVEAGLAAALGHVDHGLLAQLIRRPGHAPAMVAVGGGEEGGLAELPGGRPRWSDSHRSSRTRPGPFPWRYTGPWRRSRPGP